MSTAKSMKLIPVGSISAYEFDVKALGPWKIELCDGWDKPVLYILCLCTEQFGQIAAIQKWIHEDNLAVHTVYINHAEEVLE